MVTRGGTVLPSRGVDRPPRFLTGSPAFHQVLVGTAVLLAGALMFAAVLVVPRPDIFLTDARYFPGACDTPNRTRIVIATFTLTNRGSISGAVEVDLYADSTTLSSMVQFEVPAKASITGTLSGVASDCAEHTYSLRASYPVTSG